MEMAGLPYSVVVAEDRSQYSEWAKSNAVDVYMDISPQRSTIMDESSGVFTEPYIKMTMSRVTKKDFKPNRKYIVAFKKLVIARNIC